MHDNQTVALTCELCGKDFEIFSRNYEKVVQENMPIMCTMCFDKAIEEQEKIEVPERPKFEYTASKLTDEAFNELGKQGWELVQIVNNKAYFKRRFYKWEDKDTKGMLL